MRVRTGGFRWLYELSLKKDGDYGSGGLLVEAFLADDCLQEIAARDIIVLSTSAAIRPAELLGQHATLKASLSDGSRTAFHGYISHAAMLGSEEIGRASCRERV